MELRLQSRVYRLAFQGENGEDAFMNPSQRFFPHEPLQAFDAERELAERQRPLLTEATVSQTSKVFVRAVVGPINDPQIFAATALHSRLGEASAAPHDKVQRLDHHAL